MTTAQLLAAAVPLLVGTHMAAFFHGRASGIRFCQELRRSLGITHYVARARLPEGDHDG